MNIPAPTPLRRLTKAIARSALGLFRFRLRTLLLAITMLCVVLGLHTRRKRFEHYVAERIRPFGGMIFYDYQVDEKGFARPGAPSPLPGWLAKVVGDDFISYPAELSLGTPEANEDDIRLIGQLVSLRSLSLVCRCVSSGGFAPLSNLSRLEYLSLSSNPVDDETLRIVEHMPELRVLVLGDTRITDLSVPLLANCKRLKQLSLGPTAITRSGRDNLRAALPGCVVTWYHAELEEIEQSHEGDYPCELLRKMRAEHDAAAAVP